MSEIVSLRGTPLGVKDLEARLVRAEQLRRALERKAPFVSDDQEQTARNLHKVIKAYRTAGQLNVRLMLGRVGLGGDGDTESTKRLDTYTLPNDAGESRRSRIRKTPGKYFQIAAEIAAMVGEPEAAILSRVFEGCSYGTDYAPESDWDSENWAQLARLLNLMAGSVIHGCRLDEYWRKIRSTNGKYDARGRTIKNSAFSLGSLYVGSKEYGLAGIPIHVDDAPPVPSVVLGRKRASQPIKGWIDFQDSECLEARFTFWLEVHLALGPVNDPSSIGPLVEFRSILDARDREGALITFQNPYTDAEYEDVSRATLNGETREVRKLSLENYDLVPVPVPKFRGEHYYFGWQELSPALLRELLNSSETDEAGCFIPESFAHAGSDDVPSNRFSAGSPAAALYAYLLSGELERKLAEVCDTLARLVEEHREECAADINRGEADAILRWATSQRRTPTDFEKDR